MRLLEIAVRTLCDVPAAKRVDAVFLFGQTQDNQSSVLRSAHKLVTEKKAKKILLPGSGPKSGYPGFEAWKQALIDKGVPAQLIEGIDLYAADSLNTLIEANAMIQYARRNQYTQIYVTASPFHQLRAFMTAITAARQYYPQLKIYSHNGAPLPWMDHVAHSQGKTSGSRARLINGELERIRKYQQKGDLADDADVIRYLDTRP